MKIKTLLLTTIAISVLLTMPVFAAVKKKTTPKKMSVKIETITNSNSIDKLIEYGNYSLAESKINAKLKSNPNDIDAKALRAVLYAKQKKLGAAQKEIDSLIKKYPQKANLYYAQGLIHFAKLASSNMDYQGNKKYLIESAAENFKVATLLDRKNYKAYNALGVCDLKNNEIEKARQNFEKAIAVEPNYATAIDNLGTVDYRNNKLNEAEAKFKKAISLNSKNSTAYFHIAQVAYKRADYTKALGYLNTALTLNPNSSTIYNLLGEVYNKQGNEAAALIAFKKATYISPENVQPYMNMAKIYEKRADSEFAIEQLKTALSANSNFDDAKLKIADISYSTGKYNQALKYYGTLLGVKDYNEEALKGIANTYFEIAKVSASKNIIGSSQNFDKALDNINKAIAANPDDLELYLAKIKIITLTGKSPEQKVLLNRLTKLPIKSVADMITKGEAYYTLDDIKHSEEMFNLAINSTKTLEEDLYLGEILTYHKHYEPAKKALQKALYKEPHNEIAISNFEYILKSEKRASAFLKDATNLYNKNNNILAREYVIRSLNYNPMNPKSILLMAQVYENEKDYMSAIYAYQKYLNFIDNPRQIKRINKKIIKLEKRLK